jgi:hypothetical protein
MNDNEPMTYGPDTKERADAWRRFTDVIHELARDIPTEQLDDWFEDCLKNELDEIQMQIERQREEVT